MTTTLQRNKVSYLNERHDMGNRKRALEIHHGQENVIYDLPSSISDVIHFLDI